LEKNCTLLKSFRHLLKPQNKANLIAKESQEKKAKKLIAKTRIQLHVTCSSFRQIYPYETGLLMCDRIIAKNQTDFIKSRFTLESVVAAQELIHVAHSRDILRWF
jgi:hypothetical protein